MSYGGAGYREGEKRELVRIGTRGRGEQNER